MGNKRSKTKKPKQPKQKAKKNTGMSDRQMSTQDIGSPSPVRKPKKKA